MANYIVTDKIRVNIVHGTSVPPRVKCEQYDGDCTRQIEATVYNGDVLYTIPSEVRRIVISGLKPDNTGFSYDCTWSGTKVLFSLMRQMTVVAGSVPCNISFFDGSNNQVSSAVFVLDVEAAALPSDVVVSSNDFQTFVDYVQAANLYWQYSKSYAVGNTGIRSGENTDNSQYYAHLARMYKGSPLTAATASAMTDRTRVYVYTGSEGGYNNGHWYYYNDSVWADGGVYNAQGQQTDAELITSDIAADAKAVGDRIKWYVTPEMYGAKGDGITDDTLAIQNALDNNKEVHLFPKTYKISSIVLHSYNVLQGCGQFSVLDTSITNGSDYVITTDNIAINVVIRDLKIKCNSNTNSGGGGNGIRMVVTDYSQISEQPDTHFLIDNVYIDHPNIGCKIDEHNGDSLINNLHIRHAYNYGLIVETGDCRFSNITIGWCNKEGIYALSTMCQWDNIKVFECGMKEQNGYAVQLGAWMTVTNLVIQGAYYNALLVKSYNSISGLYIVQTNYITKSGVVNNNAHNINVNGVGNNISGTIQDGLGNVTSKYGVYASNSAMFYYETIIMSIYANNGSQIIGVASNLEALKPNSIQVTSNINSYNYVYDTAEKFNKNINQYRGYSVQKKIKIKWDSSKYTNGDKIAVFIYGFNFGAFIVKIGTDANSIAALRDIQTIISSSNRPIIDDCSTAGELLLSALSPWQEFAYLILLDTKGLATVEVVDAT